MLFRSGRHSANEVVLGVRPEDATVHTVQAQASGEVFACELTGDATLFTLSVGGARITAKAGKDRRAEIGSIAHLGLQAAQCHLFDRSTGQRLETV